ncbi:M23 family metallopeptidase [Chryseobacterium indologenes]|uniref:M23 family metallopeptidase n=1 Tax=Chryseobacterium indologenes TaxID=253 RepID=UPI00162A102A|nr:M23 family metallopeptidase [Chryseobacterium indologenes]
MKNRKTILALTILLLTSSFSLAQFNTLMPTKPQKTEDFKMVETPKEENSNPKKEKKSWKEIFNITPKSELKKETESSMKILTNQIDSLKTMLKNYQNGNNQCKADYQKMKDSLSELMQKFQPKENDEKEIQKAPFAGLGAYPPLKRITVTSPYGTRIHPIFGTPKMHNGIDLKANYEDVHAVLDGIITESGWDSKGGGNYIKIKHYNRFETSYQHLSEIYYKVGERVRAGFIIGKSGNTGNSTGPHLHFAVKEFGQSINPYHFLNDLNKANNLIATYYAN